MKTKLLITTMAVSVILLCNSNANATKWIITTGGNMDVFSPDTILNVIVGDTIRWEPVPGDNWPLHDVDSDTIPVGATPWQEQLNAGIPNPSDYKAFEYKVTVAGKYQYYCEWHKPGMSGIFVASGTLSIKQLTSLSLNLSLFPNPVKENVTLNVNSFSAEKGIIKIYDVLGNEVEKENIQLAEGKNKATLSLSELNSGIYLIELYTETKRSGMQKIIKE